MPRLKTTEEARKAILDWFHKCGEGDWVSVEDFITAFQEDMTGGQGQNDLAWLTKKGELEKRVNYEKRTKRGLPSVEYRVTQRPRLVAAVVVEYTRDGAILLDVEDENGRSGSLLIFSDMVLNWDDEP